MALTLRSSRSFDSLSNLKEIRSSKSFNDFTNMASFAQTKPSCRIQIKSSMQEDQLSLERISPSSERRKNEQTTEKLHGLSLSHSINDTRVHVFVMLPLDTISLAGKLNKPRAMNASLMALKIAGVEGVMIDAWWGLVEKDRPFKYNWEGYAELVKLVQKHGLKLQVVMSFHQCGGNVLDSCRYFL